MRELLADALREEAEERLAIESAHPDRGGDGPANDAEAQGERVGAEPVLGEGLAAVFVFVAVVVVDVGMVVFVGILVVDVGVFGWMDG